MQCHHTVSVCNESPSPVRCRYEGTAYKAASTQRTGYRPETRTQPIYNASYKTHSVEGRQNQRFDYV